MASITITDASMFTAKLTRLESNYKEIVGKAIFAGADIVADQIKANLEGIPESESFPYSSATPEEKQGLLACFGIAPMQDDADGYNVKCGFSQYLPNSLPTKKYPRGVPAPMLARSIESGSSVRRKHPFVRPAIAKTKQAAKEKMAEVIEEETQKIMGGN